MLIPARSTAASLFPLPVTPFEHYMLADDRDDYPMTFVFQLFLSGEIDRSLFESALAGALPRQPLLRSLIQRPRFRRPQWLLAQDTDPYVHWDRIGQSLEFPNGERIHLERELGLRLWIRSDHERTELTFQFHHACCDGVGALQFVDDVLGAYRARCNPNTTYEPSDFESALLRQRGATIAGTPNQPMNRCRRALGCAGQLCRAVMRPPVPVHPSEDDVSEPIVFPDIVSHTFDISPLRLAATERQVTINDLLLRDWFLVLRRWNEVQKPATGNPWLKVNVPTDLRTATVEMCPAANMVGYAFPGRRYSSCDQPEELLRSLHGEIESIKKGRLGAYFLGNLSFVQRIPGAISAFTAGRRRFATAVLSNLGDIRHHFPSNSRTDSGQINVGNLTLDRLLVVPPLRPNTHAFLAALTYNGRLTLSLRCDPHCFGETATRELLTSYIHQLEKTITQ